jgi:hypothetical protein
MTLELSDSAETPAVLPRILRFWLDVGHSSRLLAVSEHTAVPVTDNTHMRSLGQPVRLSGICTCAVVLWG